MLNFSKLNGLFLLLVTGTLILWYFTMISLWATGLLIFLWLVIVMRGSFNIRWNLFLKAFNGNKNHTQKVIALTFDDGPHPAYTPGVLRILKKYDAKATFFLIGKKVEKHPELVAETVAAGHEIGNHSFTHHSAIGFSGTTAWISEIERTDELIKKITGNTPNLFRPPFGVTTPHLARAIRKTGHRVIGWNVRSYDTVIKNPELVKKRVKRRIKPGAVVLFHDTHPNIEEILEHLLLFLQEKGYQTVPINDLINEKPA
jgi:peptidoglycan/xylan/chitin deacetylase (PgdA/CDA1 family)